MSDRQFRSYFIVAIGTMLLAVVLFVAAVYIGVVGRSEISRRNCEGINRNATAIVALVHEAEREGMIPMDSRIAVLARHKLAPLDCG